MKLEELKVTDRLNAIVKHIFAHIKEEDFIKTVIIEGALWDIYKYPPSLIQRVAVSPYSEDVVVFIGIRIREDDGKAEVTFLHSLDGLQDAPQEPAKE